MGYTTDTSEPIYRQIYGAIVDHRLPPGTRLREEALSETFGVSRTLIRKVLQRLGHEQIVELHPNRGAAVAEPSVEDAREVFTARRVVEAGLVAIVAKTADAAMIGRLRAFVARERTAQRDADEATMIRLSGEFHIVLAEMSGNGPLLDFLRELVSRTSLIIALYKAPGGAACSCHDHAGIVDLIEQRDSDGAIDVMERHLLEIEQSLDLQVPEKRRVDLKTLFAPSDTRN